MISELKGDTSALCCAQAHFVEFHDMITGISVSRP